MTVSALAPGAATVAAATSGKLRSSDLMQALGEIESSVPVADWMVAGIPIWPLLRVRWFFREWARQYSPPGSGALPWSARLLPVLRNASDAARARRIDAAANQDRSAPQDLIFLSDGLSFARLGEHWVERFCDPLIRAAARQGASSALWTPQHRYHVPRATPSVFVQHAVDRANLVGFVQSRFDREVAKRLPDRQRAAALLRARGLDDASLSLSRIASDGYRLRVLGSLFEGWLAATRPSLAFVVGYYSLEAMAFVHACRQLHIPVVDIQHGVQGEFHPGYAAWPALQRGCVHPLVPDRFWVWSVWERGIIDNWAAGSGHAAVVGGNPWLDVWRGDVDWPGTGEARAAAGQLRARAGSRPVVLVTLQFGLGHDEQLEPLRQLIACTRERYAFWVRLHPVMVSQRVEVRAALGAADAFELDAPSDLPLHALLPECDVHLTHSSSTVIEAGQFGVPSLITSAYGGELFLPSVRAGAAVVETGDRVAVEAALGRLLRERSHAALPPSMTDVALAGLLEYARQHGRRSP